MARPRKSNPVIPLTYGDALQSARDAKGWTTPQLAKKTKIDASSITKYETGQQLPPGSKNEILENYLNVSLRKEWEEVKPYWDKYLENRKAEKEAQTLRLTSEEKELILQFRKGEGSVIHLARRLEELNEAEVIRIYLQLPDDIRGAFRAALHMTEGATIPEGRAPSITIKFIRKAS